jgi:hypothetical protein
MMAQQTALGILLLIFSFVLYWPIVILGMALTDGFALICLGPLAIGLIILNIVILSNYLRRRASRNRPAWPEQ